MINCNNFNNDNNNTNQNDRSNDDNNQNVNQHLTFKPYDTNEIESIFNNNIPHINRIKEFGVWFGNIDRLNATLAFELLQDCKNLKLNNNMVLNVPENNGSAYKSMANMVLYYFKSSSMTLSIASIWILIFDTVAPRWQWNDQSINLINELISSKNMDAEVAKRHMKCVKTYISNHVRELKKNDSYKNKQSVKNYLFSLGSRDKPVLANLAYLCFLDYVCYLLLFCLF